MKRNRLKYSSGFEGKILGITTPKPGYRLCYFINKCLDLNLKKDLYEQTSSENFTIYRQHLEEDNLTITLLPNRTPNGSSYQMPRYKKIDFLLIIAGDITEKSVQSYKNQLKAINVIEGVFELPDQNFKPQKNLEL